MMKAPLSVRIVLLVLVTSGSLVVGMLATVYTLMVSDYEALVAERETAVIKRVASALELSNQQRVLGLEAFATRLVSDYGQLLDERTLQSRLLQPSVASELFPDGLLIFDAHGTAIAESEYVPGRLGTNYADRPHFQRAKQTQQAVISEPIMGRTTGLPLLSYLQPISFESGDIIGYAGGLLNLANTPLINIGSSFVESNTSTVTLVIDPRYRLFVSMQERFESLEPLPDEGVDALVDAALSVSPAGTIVEYQQASYLVTSQQLDSPGWIILRALPYSEAIAPAQASFRHFLLIALIAMTIVGFAGAWIARNLTQPIERITSRIEHMADNARFDSDFQEKGGPEVTALAHAMNRLANERKAAYVAIHKAERFLSSVLESASEVSIVATDTAGIITAFNKGAETMLGYSSQEMIGKQTPAILHLKEEVDARSTQLSTELGQSVEGFRVLVEKAEQNGSEKLDWTYVRKDGHMIPVSMVVTVMRDSAGEINGYLGIAENITERKRADKIKTEFISTVNHELRTPLTSISGALGLLVGGNFGELPAKAQALLATAHRNSKRLTHLINDLLDIEKIAEGKLHFDMQAHAVMPLLEQALEANQHYGSNRDITLSLKGNASNVLINVDSQRFMQIMANLLSNAIKFSPQGGEVILEVETTPNKVSISIIDSGPGIVNAFREQIFQRFAQADASDTRAKEGTGLGLAITRELVEHMGGRIDFESAEGKGHAFSLNCR